MRVRQQVKNILHVDACLKKFLPNTHVSLTFTFDWIVISILYVFEGRLLLCIMNRNKKSRVRNLHIQKDTANTYSSIPFM